MRPGVTIIDIDSSASGAAAVGTDPAFIAGEAERGPVGVAVKVRNQAQFEAVYGGAFAPGYLWDAARLFPLAQGSDQYYSRAVGPAAKASSAKLKDGEAADTLEVIAASKHSDTDPGAWGDDIDVKTTVDEGDVTYEVLYKGEQVEESGPLATNADAVAHFADSAYIRLKDLGGGEATAQEVSLAGGDDDRSNITDTERAAALAAFGPELGPGQLAYPGATTKAIREALLGHAKANNRIVVPDALDTATVATLAGSTGELSALDAELRACGFKPFGPWVTVAGEGGTTKTLPPSILVMAQIARRDRETFDPAIGVNNPNDPAAGINGVLELATGLSQDSWTNAEVETLNETAINVIRQVNGEIRIYGYRTLADEVATLKWANNRRIDMAILAKAAAIGEEYVFAQIDARGQKLGEFAGAITGEVLAPYHQIGALFGDTAAEAYGVDVSDAVNPPEQLAEGKVRVLIRAKRSPAAEAIEIEYAKEEVA